MNENWVLALAKTMGKFVPLKCKKRSLGEMVLKRPFSFDILQC